MTQVRIPVTAMIFTLNEEIHLPACFASLKWTDDIVVVDSYSTDRTAELCLSVGARFFQNAFEGFGKQRVWAIANTQPKYEWILVLDADERVTPELVEEMARVLPLAPDKIGAYRLKRRFHMWGRWLRYSSLYPTWVVRLIRKGRVEYVNRGHAETQEVIGKIGSLEHDLIDENLKGIDEWFERQNRYSSKEAAYELDQQSLQSSTSLFSPDPLARRAALKRLASNAPCRPWLYFVYSYFIRGGFLEGRDGLVFCMMKSEYQRMIVAKKHDLRRRK